MDRNKTNRIKKMIFLLTTYFTIVLSANAATNDNGKNELYPYNDNPTYYISPYTTYSKGNVYIADKETIKSIIVDSDDVYIIDARNQKDPNMCICNSYKIQSKEDIEEIIDILLLYEEKNPSGWERTRQSLYNELILHNAGFELGIQRTRTRNVDFNNEDEEKYDSPLLIRILK